MDPVADVDKVIEDVDVVVEPVPVELFIDGTTAVDCDLRIKSADDDAAAADLVTSR